MERKTRLYNTKTRRWEWWYIEDPVRMPWERWATRLRWAWRKALRTAATAVTAMVQMQKHIK